MQTLLVIARLVVPPTNPASVHHRASLRVPAEIPNDVLSNLGGRCMLLLPLDLYRLAKSRALLKASRFSDAASHGSGGQGTYYVLFLDYRIAEDVFKVCGGTHTLCAGVPFFRVG